MFVPSHMRRVTLVMLRSDQQAVSQALVDSGVIDVMSSLVLQDKELSKELGPFHLSVSLKELRSLQGRLEYLLQQGGERAPILTSFTEPLPGDERGFFEEQEQRAAALSAQIAERRTSQSALMRRKRGIEKIIKTLEEIGGLAGEEKFPFAICYGVLPSANYRSFEQEISSLIALSHYEQKAEDFKVTTLVLREEEEAWRAAARAAGMKTSPRLSLDTAEAESFLSQARLEREKTQKKTSEVLKSIVSLVEASAVSLRAAFEVTEHLLFNALVQSRQGATEQSTVLEFWAPQRSLKALESYVEKASGGRAHFESHAPKMGEDVPVYLRHTRPVFPFVHLIEGYGQPVYRTFDPTIPVMLFYLLAYGMMFADVGQGAILFLAGAAGWLWFSRREKKIGSPAAGSQTARLIVYGGIMAMVFGVLWGSNFGFSIPALWFPFDALAKGGIASSGLVRSIYGILLLSLYLGLAMVSLGIIIGWYNKIMRRQWFDLILGKTGALGAWIYANMAVYVGKYLSGGFRFAHAPSQVMLTFAFYIPTLLLLVKVLLEQTLIEHEKIRARDSALIFIKWFVEILEVYVSYLSQTLSFLRVAGLGIAHANLMYVFYMLARMSGHEASAIAIGVLGNIIVIALEGLATYVYSIRLIYYEFFAQFFETSEHQYLPLSLKNRKLNLGEKI